MTRVIGCLLYTSIYGQISEGTIVTAEYPVVRPEFENEEAAAGVEALKDVIRSVRNSRAEVNVAPRCV